MNAMLSKIFRNINSRSEDGFFMIETLVAISIFAVVALAFTSSAVLGLKMRLRSLHRSVASDIASDMIEEKALADPASLAAGTTTDTYTWPNNTRMRFQRVQTVTVASDGSRTVAVTVIDLNNSIGGSVQLTTTLSPWGSQ